MIKWVEAILARRTAGDPRGASDRGRFAPPGASETRSAARCASNGGRSEGRIGSRAIRASWGVWRNKKHFTVVFTIFWRLTESVSEYKRDFFMVVCYPVDHRSVSSSAGWFPVEQCTVLAQTLRVDDSLPLSALHMLWDVDEEWRT